jgi:prolipoprotein diacylglyceryl transferase
MRPILLNIPAKPLFFAALILAAVFLVRDLLRRRNDKTVPWGSTPIYLLVGAGILNYFKTDHVIPSAAGLAQTWTPVPIYAYGVMLGTSLVVGWFIAMTLAKHDGIDQQEAGSLYMWGAIWSIIGSRLLWYFTTPSASIADIPMINQGGLVAYGGMIGGTLATWYCCRKRGIPLLQWADVAAPSVVLGTGITRLGCFLFGCDYGAPSNLPWAVRFPGPNAHKFFNFVMGGPQGSPAWQHHYGGQGAQYVAECARTGLCWSDRVHPTQIYESLVGLFLFGLLMLIRKYRKFSGQVFLGWVFGYGILRPLIEQVRDDEDRGVKAISGFQLSTSTVIGLVSVVLGVGLMIALIRKYRRDPEGSKLWLHPVPVRPAAGTEAKAKGEQGGGGKRRKKR